MKQLLLAAAAIALPLNQCDPPARFDAAMAVNSLFNFEAAPWPSRVVGALVAQQQLCRFSAQSLLTLLEIQATTTRSRDFAMIAQTARILNNRC